VSDAPPVAARGLVKRYGDLVAVDHVDLTVERGDVFGYLGPNGAGKTTSLRMLLGLIRPTEGRAELFGRDPMEDGARALDGVAGFVEGPRFYPYLSARRNLRLLADLDGGIPRSRIDEVLSLVELRERANDKVGGYSHGMRQRLGIASSLLRDPKLLLLDEPTTGLDPPGMRDMRELVKRLAANGITILLSSHLLAEVEELCNRVAIIRRGRIVYEGKLADLLRTSGGEYRLRASDLERARTLLLARGFEGVTSVDGELRFQAEPAAVEAATVALGQAGIGISSLVPHTATLEELFFELVEDETPEPDSPEAPEPGSAEPNEVHEAVR
jgi:ABC-2 type transport system ATP-binding protein